MQQFGLQVVFVGMHELYNFLFSWQLFPEMGTYHSADRPKSGTYKISYLDEASSLQFELNWVGIDNHAYNTSYLVTPNGEKHVVENNLIFDEAAYRFQDHKNFTIHLFSNGKAFVDIAHEILHNGYLKVTETKFEDDGTQTIDISIYHKQLSVLPYAASVAGAVIKPTEVGMIKHKALAAMEEQTDLQLNQIRQQIELLASQAQEINRRKELSMMIYNAQLSFTPVMGNTYHLYEKKDGSYFLSMIAPKEWKNQFVTIASVKMLADHTWIEVK